MRIDLSPPLGGRGGGIRAGTAPRGGGPTFFRYQYTHGVAFLGEQAAAPPPPMDRAAAVRGAAIPGRPI